MPGERFCNSCETPLPDGAAYCPACGEATPTELNRATGEAAVPEGPEVDELAYRRRLQRAIGQGYQLGELIGQGGFGVVYSALDIELNREVAVKALRHDVLPTSALFQRFKREARSAAKLRHPHIVPLYAVGEGEGIAFMIMPKLVGESLKALIRREAPIPVEEARRILVDASRALGVAHRAGIVHRDVKPENIFVEGEERRVHLMDFGIAKALDTEEEGLTGTGMIVGTPSYMSPEQSGGRGEIDHRTDIYSLGVVGYQLMTGRLPYLAESLQELIYQQVTTTPASLSEVRPDVPPEVGHAIDRCLCSDPMERWTTADEFADALEGRGSAATVVPARSWKRTAWLGGAAVFIAVAGYMGAQAFSDDGESPGDGAPAAAVALVGSADDSTVADSRGPQPEASVPTGEVTAESEVTTPPPVQETTPPAEQPARQPTAPAAQQPEPNPIEAEEEMGYLTVNPRPGWASVYIDDVFLARAPFWQRPVPPGTYVITLRKTGYREWVDTVTITAGNELPLGATLLELP